MTSEPSYPVSRIGAVAPSVERLLVARKPLQSLLPERLPARVKNVRSLPEARRALRRMNLCSALVESGFDAGHGFAFALEFRKQQPLAKILFHAEAISSKELLWAQEARISVLTSACSEEDVLEFVRDATTSTPTRDLLTERVERFALEYQLTPREARIVRALADGRERDEMLEAFGVTANTLKTQARSLLRKTQLKSLHAVTRAVLTDTIARGNHPGTSTNNS